MTLNAKCKFCGKQIAIDCDDDGLTIIKAETWLPKIACDRCADYKTGLRKLESSIFSICQLLRGCRQSMTGSSRLELESKIREKLDALTKRFCAIVCDHFRLSNIWESAVPEMIFNKPDRAGAVLSDYIRTKSVEAGNP